MSALTVLNNLFLVTDSKVNGHTPRRFFLYLTVVVPNLTKNLFRESIQTDIHHTVGSYCVPFEMADLSSNPAKGIRHARETRAGVFNPLFTNNTELLKGGQLIFQGALGKQDLGRLHYRPVKDRNGSTVIVAVNHAIVSIEPLKQIAVRDS